MAGPTFVEVIRPFKVLEYEVRPGSRLHGIKSPAGWVVLFNGLDLLVPAGTVGEIDSPEVKAAAEERRSAREEEYQTAPTRK